MRGPIIPIAGFQAQKGEAFREIARDITEAGPLVGESVKARLDDSAPYSFTKSEWAQVNKDMIKTGSTLEKPLRRVFDILNERAAAAGTKAPKLDYDELRTGKSPVLDLIEYEKGKKPFERKMTDGQMLTFFTNVQDFGLYEEGGPNLASARAAAATSGIINRSGEAAGEFIAGGLSLPLAYKAARAVPPGPYGAFKAGAFLGTLILPVLAGSFAGGKIEDFALSPEDPVIEELQSAYNAGETTSYAFSMMGALMGTRVLKKNVEDLSKKIPTLGASNYVDDFYKVAPLVVAGKSDDYIAAFAKDKTTLRTNQVEGIKNKIKGRMNKAETKGKDLDEAALTRLPTGAKVTKGIEKTGRSVRKKMEDTPKEFIAAEVGISAAAGAGAFAAQEMFPYNDFARVSLEVATPMVVVPTLKRTKDLIVPAGKFSKKAGGKFKDGFYFAKDMGKAGSDLRTKEFREVSDRTQQAVSKYILGKVDKQALQRYETAIANAPEFDAIVDPVTSAVLVTRPERVKKFIDELVVLADKTIPDEDEAITLATLADKFSDPDARDFVRKLSNEFIEGKETIKSRREEVIALKQNEAKALLLNEVVTDPTAFAVSAEIYQDLVKNLYVAKINSSRERYKSAQKRLIGEDVETPEQRAKVDTALRNNDKKLFEQAKNLEKGFWSKARMYPLTGPGTWGAIGKESIPTGYERVRHFMTSDSGSDLVSLPESVRILEETAQRIGLFGLDKGTKSNIRKSLGATFEDIMDNQAFFTITPKEKLTLKKARETELKLNDALLSLRDSLAAERSRALSQNLAIKDTKITALMEAEPEILAAIEENNKISRKIANRLDRNMKIRLEMENDALIPEAAFDNNNLAKYPFRVNKVKSIRGFVREAQKKAKDDGNDKTSAALKKLELALYKDLIGDGASRNKPLRLASAYTRGMHQAFDETSLEDSVYRFRRGLDKFEDTKIVNRALNIKDPLTIIKSVEDRENAFQFLIENRKKLKNEYPDFKPEGILDELDFETLDPKQYVALAFKDRFREFIKIKDNISKITNEKERVPELQRNAFNQWRNTPGTRELEEMFPIISSSLDDMESADDLYRYVVNDPFLKLDPKFRSEKDKAYLRQTTPEQMDDFYAQIASRDAFEGNTVVAVQKALKSENPIKALNGLVKIIDDTNYSNLKNISKTNKKRVSELEKMLTYGGLDSKTRSQIEGAIELAKKPVEYTRTQARKALSSAILDVSMDASDTGFQPSKMADILNGQMKKVPRSQALGPEGSSRISLLDYMVNSNLITKAHKENINKALQQAVDVEAAINEGTLGALLSNPGEVSQMKLTTVRIIGAMSGNVVRNKISNIIKTIGLNTGGGGLIAESEGSKLMQKYILEAPAVALNNSIENFFNDPALLGEMLKAPNTAFENIPEKMLKGLRNLLLSLGDPQLATTGKINPLIQDQVREQQERDNRRQNRKNNKKESEKTASLIKDTINSFFAPAANASEYSNSGGTPVEAPQAYAPQAYALNDITNAVQPNTTSSVNSPRASNIRPNPVRRVATGPVTSPTTNPTAVGIQGSITPESAQRFAQVFGANDPVLTMGIGGLVR